MEVVEKNERKHASDGTVTSGKNISFWLDSAEPISYSALDKDIVTNVVVVGGGIAGLTIAYSLVQSGKKVVLIEDGNIGSGETGRTTAHLVTALDDRYYHLKNIYGEEQTRLIAESQKAAIDFIERTIKNHNIDCDFERLDGYLFLHPTDKRESLTKELRAVQNAGIEAVELPITPGLTEIVPCLKFYDQAQFHPVKYLKGLCDAVLKMGGQIYTNTHASQINDKGIVTETGYKVHADIVIIATNSPVNNKFVMHLKQYAYRTYVIGARVKKGSVPKALWWDTGDFKTNSKIPPYHYIRTHHLDNNYDILICGGEDHPVGIADEKSISEEDHYSLLEYWVRQRFPIVDIIYQWSGQILEPMDSLAYIGRNPNDKENVFIATGDSGNGMTNGTIAGIIIPDLINGRKNEWAKVYDPARFKLFSAGGVFFREVIGGTIAYLKNKPHDVKSLELASIPVDEGKIVELEGKKVGAYRDKANALHVVSAECSHLKCIIKWNNTEKSWDCPCHGSRYTYDGKVINGPANADLPYYSETN
jgi:glycine/D-amino acid oxidase-like deaminating enzyme/nitrite reductase/ring-hydroxylating ferredoxin subunit